MGGLYLFILGAQGGKGDAGDKPGVWIHMMLFIFISYIFFSFMNYSSSSVEVRDLQSHSPILHSHVFVDLNRSHRCLHFGRSAFLLVCLNFCRTIMLISQRT